MNVPKNERNATSAEAVREALRFLTPAEAETLRRRFGLDNRSAEGETDEVLREMARELSALKKRRKRR